MNLKARRNQLVEDTVRSGKILIAAHRGTASGNIIQNTINAYFAAWKMGADIVECDVSMTDDGRLMMYHDGGELSAFGISKNMKTMSIDEVEQLRYFNCIRSKTNQRVQTLDEVLAALKGRGLINLDRGWEYWGEMSDLIESHGIAEQIILKSPVEDAVLSCLEELGKDYMYIPIVHSPEELEKALSYKLNHLGIEVVFPSRDEEIADPKILREIKDRGLLLWGNAITLNERELLADNFDDNTSILINADLGWGHLLKMGFNIIQTDWPAQLKGYIEESGGGCRSQ